MTTKESYRMVMQKAKRVFLQKTHDYGTAWRALRDISIADQIYIKVKRICTLQELKQAQIADSIEDEWIGVINYSIIGLIQKEKQNTTVEDLSEEEAALLFDKKSAMAFELMEKKNHDYGEAWREMRHKSIADICMMKIYRMQKIIENKEQSKASEGIEANYLDLINYAIFYLIKDNA